MLKPDAAPGEEYLFSKRSFADQPIKSLFKEIFGEVEGEQVPSWRGDTYIGHIRYATHGYSGLHYCHPVQREHDDKKKHLLLAGNFNMTNNEELFQRLVAQDRHPRDRTDTITVLQTLALLLEKEDANNLEEGVRSSCGKAMQLFDGGYSLTGALAEGTSFIMRDPNGIRPLFFYKNDDIVVAASERPPIMTALGVKKDEVQEFPPGAALVAKAASVKLHQLVSKPKASCSFERIYFSRGNDADIYEERKAMGKALYHSLAVDTASPDTIYSYIPNTAEVSFIGMQQAALEDFQHKGASLPRFEKIAVKDVKIRTFITDDSNRSTMVGHVYDTTYGVVEEGKSHLIVVDDSIVRGTTLRESIIAILYKLKPRKITIASAAPIILFPDCYGIDMSRLQDLVGYRAAILLRQERNEEALLDEIYQLCLRDQDTIEAENHALRLYHGLQQEELEGAITRLLVPEDIQGVVNIVYQRLDNLKKILGNSFGYWYFDGRYPTPGGNRVANRAYLYAYEGRRERAYS